MTIRELQQAFDGWAAEGRDLVLASVFETLGSTYSKAGARMLITDDGRFQGMLSGGCLEGDLAERAARVLESGVPESVTYDLGRSDDELWGLGVGCDGLMRIFLQPLTKASAYQPFVAISEVLAGDDAGIAATVLDSSDADLEPGATLVWRGTEDRAFGLPAAYREALLAASRPVEKSGHSTTVELAVGGHSVNALIALLRPPLRLLVLGGGLDARPVVQFARRLGWRVTLQDHRPAYIESGNFAAADRVLCKPAAELSRHVALERFDAVVVMSHHLATDRVYLRQLAATAIPYVGLLGPRDRRRRLLEDLDEPTRLTGRLHGPAGLDIGGDGPASIALSIIAEIHQELLREGSPAAAAAAAAQD